MEESELAIESAYKEGYKQAIVETKPDVLYWEKMYKEQKKKTVKNSLIFSGVGLASGFILGNVTGYSICLKLQF